MTQTELSAICIDMGTTNTRAWLMRGDQVIASDNRQMGVRNTAQARSSAHIEQSLRELVTALKETAQTREDPCTPVCVAAAGMIGSSLGLMDVPHLRPPVGIEELSAAAYMRHFPEVTELPVVLVPGVRSGATASSPKDVSKLDVMRGEETVCAGLVLTGVIAGPAVVLNLGSHWKAIQIDQQGRILSSITSISGELVHAVQLHTILASSVFPERPERLSPEWLKAGMVEQRRSGLSRALFCVRLLDLENQGTQEDRLAFMVGAFIASDLDALRSIGVLKPNLPVALVGSTAVAEAWRQALNELMITATVIRPEQTEKALLTALRKITIAALNSSREFIPQEAARR